MMRAHWMNSCYRRELLGTAFHGTGNIKEEKKDVSGERGRGTRAQYLWKPQVAPSDNRVSWMASGPHTRTYTAHPLWEPLDLGLYQYSTRHECSSK